MSMWDLTSDDGQTTAHEHAKTPDEKAMRWPQAYSTMFGAHGKESGYATKENGGIDSVKVGTHDGTSPCNKSQGLVASCELAIFATKSSR